MFEVYSFVNGSKMLAQVLDYNYQVGAPAVLNLPEVPLNCFHPSVDMLEDGIWMSCWDVDDFMSDQKKTLVFQLVGGEWVRVICEKTLEWFDKKDCAGEIEYEVV